MERYVASPVLPGASPSFAFEPIFVHPGHGLDVPSWPETPEDTTEDDEDDQLPMINELEIYSPPPQDCRRGSDLSDGSDANQFSPYLGGYQWPSSSSLSSFESTIFENDSRSSSRSSTPTPETPGDEKALAFTTYRSTSRKSLPTLAVSSFFFNSSPEPEHATLRGPSSPSRANGGATMKRSFSLPVEQEHVLRNRLSYRSSLHTAANVMSPSLSRTPSSSGLASGSSTPPLSMRRRPSLSRRESAPSTGLGFSLPPSNVHLAFTDEPSPYSPPPSAFPFNIVSPKRTRLARSYSTPDVPTFHPLTSRSSTFEATSSPLIPRPRRPTFDFGMTPIIPEASTFIIDV
ncbi:hypothetical protein P7C70_g2118, partial [Phenoliferia sp. Uapishka_3]